MHRFFKKRWSASTAPGVFSSPAFIEDDILYKMGAIWRSDKTRKLYREELKRRLDLQGLPFIEEFARQAMHLTLANCQPHQANFFLMRLLYLIAKSQENQALGSRRASAFEYTPFPLHPTSVLAHGKRLSIRAPNIWALKAWLSGGVEHHMRRRVSSHSVTSTPQGPVEALGLGQAFHSLDTGFHLAIFGEGNLSPFTNQYVMPNGHFGHICIAEDQVKGPTTEGDLLVGIENSGPLLSDQQGNSHGPACNPKLFSAFFLPKWDSELLQCFPVPIPDEKTNVLAINLSNSFIFAGNQEVQEYVLQHVLPRTTVGNFTKNDTCRMSSGSGSPYSTSRHGSVGSRMTLPGGIIVEEDNDVFGM